MQSIHTLQRVVSNDGVEGGVENRKGVLDVLRADGKRWRESDNALPGGQDEQPSFAARDYDVARELIDDGEIGRAHV